MVIDNQIIDLFKRKCRTVTFCPLCGKISLLSQLVNKIFEQSFSESVYYSMKALITTIIIAASALAVADDCTGNRSKFYSMAEETIRENDRMSDRMRDKSNADRRAYDIISAQREAAYEASMAAKRQLEATQAQTRAIQAFQVFGR